MQSGTSEELDGDRRELIGHDLERDRLRGLVTSLASGIGGAIVVVGPAGIGKSELLRNAASHARSGTVPTR
ncbi:ATP-binding protein, partial [Phytoactinopolyspora endophytica]|uniref:ATP-binding protein n=1 Tax=Phytoactinopolyspora endophytica TaxID=1642495 RepID=UPI00197C5D77